MMPEREKCVNLVTVQGLYGRHGSNVQKLVKLAQVQTERKAEKHGCGEHTGMQRS